MGILALIPARGGSRGIKRKNLVPLAGHPLVSHSVRHALACPWIERTVVSTDDEEIREVAVLAGAEVPFLRPAELSGDLVLDLPVFHHALEYLKGLDGYTPDLVVHLRPTAPYRKPGWIEAAIDLLRNRPEADSVRSVSAPSQHPYRIFRLDATGFLDPLMKHEHPAPHTLRRQDLPGMYYYNCVIDVTRTRTILEKRSMTGDRIYPFIMDAEEVVDIDTPRDLKVAEVLMGGGQRPGVLE